MLGLWLKLVCEQLPGMKLVKCVRISDVGEKGGFETMICLFSFFFLKLAKGNQIRDLFVSKLLTIVLFVLSTLFYST